MATSKKKTPSKKVGTGGAGASAEAPPREAPPPRPQAPAAARPGTPGSSAQPGAPTNSPDLRSVIARRAYELYEAAGRPDGQAEAHWLQAEAEVLARAGVHASR